MDDVHAEEANGQHGYHTARAEVRIMFWLTAPLYTLLAVVTIALALRRYHLKFTDTLLLIGCVAMTARSYIDYKKSRYKQSKRG